MKILVVSYNPFSTTNNTKTMLSLFSNIGLSNDIYMLYFEGFSVVDCDFCNGYYRITDQDILRSIFTMGFKTSNTHPNKDGVHNNGLRFFGVENKRKMNLRIFRELIWSFKTWDSKNLSCWIEDYSPDIIFSILGNNLFVHTIVRTISKRYKIPFFVYCTDDYLLNCPDRSFLAKIHFILTRKVFAKTIRNASRCYVIGEKMKYDYEKRFGCKFGILGNCIDFEKFDCISPKEIDVCNRIIISFIGGVHLNRWRTICDFGKLIQAINNEQKWQIEVKVYSSYLDNSIKSEFWENGVVYGGSLDSYEVLQKINESDILLHVESFDERNRRFTKYSISTKISEYLASKRYIIAYGPFDIASIELFKNNNFGCVITDMDTYEEKKRKIINAIINCNSYDYLRQYNYAKKNYDKNVVNEYLEREMCASLKIR